MICPAGKTTFTGDGTLNLATKLVACQLKDPVTIEGGTLVNNGIIQMYTKTAADPGITGNITGTGKLTINAKGNSDGYAISAANRTVYLTGGVLAFNGIVTGDCPFADVADGKCYANSVTWAAANEIVDGYGDGAFDLKIQSPANSWRPFSAASARM